MRSITHIIAWAIVCLCSHTGYLYCGERITLQNPYLSITLDSKTGEVLSIRNEKTGADYIAEGAAGYYPFIVDAYSANQSIYIRDYQLKQSGGWSLVEPESLKVNQGDLIHLRDSFLEEPEIIFQKLHNGSRVTCSYHLADGIYLHYTITMRDDSPLAEWKVQIENRAAVNPEKDLRVYTVAFPVLDGLKIGSTETDDFLARPFVQGEVIPDPVHYSFRNIANKMPNNVLTYIGWATMPWMDLYDKNGGLYLASYDPTLEQIDLEAFPDLEKNAMTLDIRTLAFTEPGQSWDSQTFIVGIHEGDWHWAADTYRSWTRSWMEPRESPDWLEDADGWFGTGGPNYKYGTDLPRMLEDARWLGLDYLQVWSEMLENVGENFSRKSYYCFFLPDPDRGGEKGITEGIRKVKQMGGHIGFYSNVWTFDAELPRPLLQWKDKIPSDVAIPDWWGEFRKYASVFPDGLVYAGNYKDRPNYPTYSGMCPAAGGWQDYLKFWIVDKYVKEYGADSWYLDSFPVTMFSAARICFSREHGHKTPHGIGRGCLELSRKLKKSAASEGVTLALTSETVNDALMQYQTHALGMELGRLKSHFPYPEIYSYTYPEHLIFSGSCNTWKGVIQYYDDMPDPRHEDAMNRVFLIGIRFDILGFPIDRDNPYWIYMKKLINLRQKIKSHLYKSSLKDQIGLGQLPRNVEVRIFRHNEGESLTLTILDRRSVKDSFEIYLDLSLHAVKELKNAVFYDFLGEKQIAVSHSGDRNIKLVIPQREGTEPAAVIIQ